MYDSVASSIEQFGETFTTLSLAPAWLLLPKGSLAGKLEVKIHNDYAAAFKVLISMFGSGIDAKQASSLRCQSSCCFKLLSLPPVY